MKKSKKIICLVLAIAIAISVLTTALIVTANAKETTVNISVDKTELANGESATVSVSVKSNYPIATMSIPVFYDKELVDVGNAVATLTNYSFSNAIVDSESVDIDKIYANTNIDSGKFGFVLVNYIGEAGAELPDNVNDVVLTFEITAKAGISGTAVLKTVEKSAKTEENIEGMLYFGAPVTGKIINEIPENVENVDLSTASANVVIKNEAPKLVSVDGTSGVVDDTNKYIYGISAGSNINDLFKVKNGKINLVANENGVTNGTGAKVQVLDGGNQVVDTYTVIIFGDVNGDGEVTMADADTVTIASLGTMIEDTICNMAADVNGDIQITMADSIAVELASLGAPITTNPYIE